MIARRLRAAAAAFALLWSVLPLGSASLAAATTALNVSVDDAPLGAIAVDRSAGGPQIELAPLARAIGWRVDLRQRSLQLTGDDRTVALTIGSRAIREEGELSGSLREVMVERRGALYVAAADAAALFGLQLAHRGSTLAFARPQRLDQTATIDEVRRPPTPRPRPTPSPPPSNASATTTFGGGPTDAGRVVVSLEETNGIRALHLTGESHGAFVQTYVDASGVDGFGTPNATVQLGGSERGAAIGLMGDPLSGDIIGGSVFEGVDVRRLDRNRQYFAGRRLADGLSELGVISGDPLRGADTLALLRDGDGDTDVLVGRSKRWHRAWGDYTAEAMTTARGAGIGLSARTSGRTFVESRIALQRGLPVGADDEPVAIDVGRRLSDVTTLAGGVGTGGTGGLSPFIGLSSRLGSVSGAVSYANRVVSTSVALQTGTGSLQAFETGGAQPTFGLAGSFAFRSASLDMTGTSSAGERDASIALRTTRSAIGVIAGVGLDGNRVGPIVGLALPLTRLIALEGTVRTAAAGGASTRLALAVRVPRAAPRGPRTVAMLIHVDGAGAQRLRYLVDGAPVHGIAVDVATARVDVTPGAHVFAVERVDGSVGSPPVNATAPSTGTIELPLWPERAIAGRVRLADAGAEPSDIVLSGIVVTIAPGDASAVTDADGRFFFGKQPFAPDARLAVDPDTLPPTLRAPEPLALSGGEIDVALPGLRIEEQTFPAARPAVKPATRPTTKAATKAKHSSSSVQHELSAADILSVGRRR